MSRSRDGRVQAKRQRSKVYCLIWGSGSVQERCYSLLDRVQIEMLKEFLVEHRPELLDEENGFDVTWPLGGPLPTGVRLRVWATDYIEGPLTRRSIDEVEDVTSEDAGRRHPETPPHAGDRETVSNVLRNWFGEAAEFCGRFIKGLFGL